MPRLYLKNYVLHPLLKFTHWFLEQIGEAIYWDVLFHETNPKTIDVLKMPGVPLRPRSNKPSVPRYRF